MEVPQVVRTYVETFTADGLDQWIATFATDGPYSDPRTVQPVMKHDLAAYFDGLYAGFPDLRCETVALGSISEHVGSGASFYVERTRAPLEAYPRQGAA